MPEIIDHFAEQSFAQRAQSLQQQLWHDLEHSQYSGIEVQRDLSQHHRRNINLPVVFTSTLYQSKDQNGVGRRWLGEDVELSYPTPQVWLDYVVAEERGELQLLWSYVDGLFHEDMLQQMLLACCRFLHDLAQSDDPWPSHLLL